MKSNTKYVNLIGFGDKKKWCNEENFKKTLLNKLEEGKRFLFAGLQAMVCIG